MNTREKIGHELYIKVCWNQPEKLQKLLLENAERADEDKFQITDFVVPGNYTTLMEMAVIRCLWECIAVIASTVPADREDKAKYGEAVLRSLQCNKLHLVPLLLKSGAKANKFQNYLHQSCLHIAINIAIISNDASTMMLLLEQDKEKLYLSKRDWQQRTPQDVLFQSNNIALMQSFLTHYQTKYGNDFVCENFINPILEANRPEILKWLFTTNILTLDWQSKAGHRYHILHSLVKRNMLDTLKWFLDQGANPHVEDGENITPVCLAARLGNFNSVIIILEHINENHFAISHQKNSSKIFKFILLNAANADRNDVIQFLLKTGMPASEIKPDLIILAVKSNMLTAAGVLIQNNYLSVDTIDPANGDSLVHIAVRNHNSMMLKMLLKFKPDLAILNEDRKTALELSLNIRLEIGLKTNSSLWKYNPDQRMIPNKTDCQMLSRAKQNDRDNFYELLNKSNKGAITPEDVVEYAYVACLRKRFFMIPYLFQQGLSVNTILRNGDTVLHMIIREKNVFSLQNYLAFNPVFTIKNSKENMTPLSLAIHIFFMGGIEKILLKMGTVNDNTKEELQVFLIQAGQAVPASLKSLLLKLGISNQEEQKEEKSREGEVEIKREKEITPEEEAILVEHNLKYAEMKHEVMWATTLFAQDRRQHFSTSSFSVSATLVTEGNEQRRVPNGIRLVPDGVLFNILLMLGASTFSTPNIICLRIAHLAFIQANVNLNLEPLVRSFVSTYRTNESSFFSRKRTIESQQFVKTLEDILLSPQYTADVIIAAVTRFVKTKEKDPKKEKSDTWKLLENSGLLKFVNIQTITSEEKHVVPAETAKSETTQHDISGSRTLSVATRAKSARKQR